MFRISSPPQKFCYHLLMRSLMLAFLVFVIAILFFVVFVSVPRYECRLPDVMPKPNQKCSPGIILGHSLLNTYMHRKPNQKEIEKIVKSDCIKYSDGCNTLSLQDGAWMTTLMACSYFQEPRCLESPSQ